MTFVGDNTLAEELYVLERVEAKERRWEMLKEGV